MKFSFYKDRYDNIPKHVTFANWNEFANEMEQESRRPLNNKEEAQLISPACYKEHETRSKTNEPTAQTIFVDVDNTTSIMHVLERLATFNMAAIIHTSASNTTEYDKNGAFRVILPLHETCSYEVHYQATYNATWLLAHGCVDTTKIGAESMFYLPAHYATAINYFFNITGYIYDASDLMLAGGQYYVPPTANYEVWDDVVCRSKNGSVDLFNHRAIPNNAIDTYLNSEKGGRMFKFLCATALKSKTEKSIINEYELLDLAVQLTRLDNTPRQNLLRECRKAIQWAWKKEKNIKI